jgi:two-component system response regulator MprA
LENDIEAALESIFSADSGIYQTRGFQRRIGFGQRPALLHIDLANAWTLPGHAFSCDGMDVIIPAVQRLNDAGRAKGIPIVYTTTAGLPFARSTTSLRSSTVSTRGCRISSNGCSGNCASSAATSRVAVSPVASETMCSSTGEAVTGRWATSFHDALRLNKHNSVMRILVVDDERAVRDALERALRLEGYEVSTAPDGQEALVSLARRSVDAIVLDVLMPVMDGLETCRALRRQGDATPVLLLTARHEVSDRVAGLDAGADDYLVKPFALEELLARLRALLRRTIGGDELLSFADLTLDPGTREVRRGDRQIELTRTEFLLLELFLRNPRQVLTRDVIFDRVWGYDFGPASNSLEVYVGYLRRKTEAEGEPRLIHTVRGVGYALREA